MARTHSVPAIVIELSGEEKLCVAMPSPPPLCLIRKTDLDAIPGFMIDDRLVQTVMDVPLVAKPSDVDRVRKDPVEMAPRHQFAAGPSSCVPRSAEMLCPERDSDAAETAEKIAANVDRITLGSRSIEIRSDQDQDHGAHPLLNERVKRLVYVPSIRGTLRCRRRYARRV